MRSDAMRLLAAEGIEVPHMTAKPATRLHGRPLWPIPLLRQIDPAVDGGLRQH